MDPLKVFQQGRVMYQWPSLEVGAPRSSDFICWVLFGLLWVFSQEIVDIFE